MCTQEHCAGIQRQRIPEAELEVVDKYPSSLGSLPERGALLTAEPPLQPVK